MTSLRAEPAAPPLRWGILGTGSIAASFVADLAHTDSGYASAVGSRNADSAERFAEAHAIAGRHASYQALVADPHVDVVYVATPHPMHLPNALLAIEAGKSVLVEKPFTMNADEAGQLADAARYAGAFLMEAMWTRFLPHMVEIRGLRDSGALGELVTVIADHGQWFEQRGDFRLFAPELGGGALLDLGVYPVSFAEMMLGRPIEISSMASPAFTGVDSQTSMLFRYPNGAQALLTCTSLAVSATRASVIGTEARIEIPDGWYRPNDFQLIRRGQDPVTYTYPRVGTGLQYEAEHVAACIAAGLTESPVLPLSETVAIMQILDVVLAQSSPL